VVEARTTHRVASVMAVPAAAPVSLSCQIRDGGLLAAAESERASAPLMDCFPVVAKKLLSSSTLFS